jgi:hypothetical protein
MIPIIYSTLEKKLNFTGMNKLDKLLKLLFAALAILLASFLLYLFKNWNTYVWTRLNIIALVIFPAMYFFIVVLAQFGKINTRLNVFLGSISFIFALYIAELGLIIAGPYITLPANYDRRTKLDVVVDSRKSGIEAYPSLHPRNILEAGLKINQEPVIPLAGIPNVTTVFCNETGKYHVYESDEYGFSNPKQLYRQGLDLALIGDSFTQGFCAGSASYAEQIRKLYPNLLNLGINGDGPLIELATLREFVAPIRPKNVIWFYFEGNDIDDLSNELGNPVLQNYLKDPNFTQNLMQLTPVIDTTLKSYVESSMKNELNKSRLENIRETLPEEFMLWAKLWHLRALLGATDIKRDWKLRHWNPQVSEDQVGNALKSILPEADKLVKSWGGQFFFVYIPSYRTFGYGVTHPWRDRVLDIVNSNGIKTIDLLEEFKHLDDPIAFYNYRKESHFTDEGNAFVAKKILEHLPYADSAASGIPGLTKTSFEP